MSGNKEKQEDSISYWINMGGDIAGSILSAEIVLKHATSEGVIAGGTLGPLVGNTLKSVGQDIKNRFLSKRETQRISSAYIYILEKFYEHSDNGKQVRTDNFFNETEEENNQSYEILEGVLLAAQKSYEERKVKYISYFCANLIFENKWDRHFANLLLRLAEELSYRQFCLLSIYFEKDRFGLKDTNDSAHQVRRYDTMYDIFLLGEKKLFDVYLPSHSGGNLSLQGSSIN